ncbi:hypothetical protein V8E54_006868 [Elaphomyces granulatus]
MANKAETLDNRTRAGSSRRKAARNSRARWRIRAPLPVNIDLQQLQQEDAYVHFVPQLEEHQPTVSNGQPFHTTLPPISPTLSSIRSINGNTLSKCGRIIKIRSKSASRPCVASGKANINLSTSKIIQEAAKLRTKIRHVDIHSHWLRQEVQQRTIRLQWCKELTSAEDQQEDVVKQMSASIFSLTPSPPAKPDPSEPLPQSRIRDEEPNAFVLAMGLWCEEAEPHPSLSKMPQSLQPLRRRVYGHLPQLGLRRAQIALNPEKMATMAESRKQQAMNLGVDHPLEYLYFFDPHILFIRLLSSEIRRKMHFGFGHFVDNPTEPWHSRAWLASARSTSGRYAHYRNGDVLLPSDMVLYECPSADCLCTPPHLGRVVGVGLDYRNDIPRTLKIRIQVAQRYDEISEKLHSQRRNSYVQLDYDTRLTNPLPHLPVDRPFLLCKSTLRSGGELLPLCYTHPVRAELEIKAFGRQHFTEYFNSSNASNCLSVPLFTFIDGFGLYRNSYRSLMGIYLLIAAFGFEERNRRANVFPVTLGPHGSNFNEVINCLTGLRELDRGVSLPLPQPTRVCAFTFAFLGDMPQQQANAGFKSQRADLSCRFCVVSAERRGDLSYDILRSGRYHHSTMQQRSEMDEIGSTTKREEYGRKWGLQTGETALFRLTPALDIVLTRPSDPAHSEFGGIVRQLQARIITLAGPTAKQDWDDTAQRPCSERLNFCKNKVYCFTDAVDKIESTKSVFAAVVQCTSALMTRTMEPETRSRLGDCVKHGSAQFQLRNTLPFFKKIVYNTNHSDVEKALLKHEALRQSVRLILANAFAHDEPQITAMLQRLRQRCPTLFQSLLPQSEHHNFPVPTLTKTTDIAATARLQNKYCREMLMLPTCGAEAITAFPSFATQLRMALAQDYNMPNIFQFGSKHFQWCKHVSFSSGQRFTFSVNDFVRYREGLIGRIEGVFILNLSGFRAFFKLQEVDMIEGADPVLNLPRYRLAQRSVIVGLPNITPVRIYVVPVMDAGRTSFF